MRRPDARGAAAILMAVLTCFVILPISALAVDIGQQRVVRSDMQTAADTVSLDMARLLGSGTTPTDAVAQSDFANSALGGTPTLKVFTGYIDPSATWVSNQSLGCGSTRYNTYFQNPSVVGKPANAVLVAASGSTKFSLSRGSGAACRSSISNAYLQACMAMDSYAAALKSGDSAVLGPLNKWLGTSIDTTVLGSSGILTTNLNVLSFLNILKTEVGVGSVDQVLTSQVTAAQVVQAEIDALNNQGGTATLAAQVLQTQILGHVGAIAGINVGSLLGITAGSGSALGATVNPLDLAGAAVALANGSSAIALSVTPGNLTGLAVTATVGSRPLRVCLGDGMQSMGQTKVTASANINTGVTGAVTNAVSSLSGLLSGVLGLLGGLLGADTYDVPQVTLGTVTANVSLAQASGQITALTCSGGSPTSMSVLEQASLAPAIVTIPITVSETRHFGSIFARQSETRSATLTLTISTQSQADQTRSDTLAIPGDYDTGKAGPSNDLSVGSLSVTSSMTPDVQFSNGYFLLGKMLKSVSDTTNALQTNLVAPLESAVVTPLLNGITSSLKSLLGVTLAGSTYTPLRTPSCNTPQIVG